MFKTGIVPEILITDTDSDVKVGSGKTQEDVQISITCDRNLLQIPLDTISHDRTKEILPLVYDVDCLCDHIAVPQTEPIVNDRSSDSLEKSLKLAERDASFWPKGTPSNQNTWDNLPVKQIISRTDTKGNKMSTDPPRVVHKSQSATATLDPVTQGQSNEVTRRVTQAVRLTPSVSKGKSKLSQGVARGELPRGLTNPKGCAPITSFFVRNTVSADSDSTLKNSDSSQTFASVVQGSSFNANDYVSNSQPHYLKLSTQGLI